MAHWNYRILVDANPEDKEEVLFFDLHSVYYDDDGNPEGYSKPLATISSDILEHIPPILKRMEEALKKPVLWKGDRWPEEYKPEDDKT